MKRRDRYTDSERDTEREVRKAVRHTDGQSGRKGDYKNMKGKK